MSTAMLTRTSPPSSAPPSRSRSAALPPFGPVCFFSFFGGEAASACSLLACGDTGVCYSRYSPCPCVYHELCNPAFIILVYQSSDKRKGMGALINAGAWAAGPRGAADAACLVQELSRRPPVQRPVRRPFLYRCRRRALWCASLRVHARRENFCFLFENTQKENRNSTASPTAPAGPSIQTHVNDGRRAGVGLGQDGLHALQLLFQRDEPSDALCLGPRPVVGLLVRLF